MDNYFAEIDLPSTENWIVYTGFQSNGVGFPLVDSHTIVRRTTMGSVLSGIGPSPFHQKSESSLFLGEF